jgi:hypothetical protein
VEDANRNLQKDPLQKCEEYLNLIANIYINLGCNYKFLSFVKQIKNFYKHKSILQEMVSFKTFDDHMGT